MKTNKQTRTMFYRRGSRALTLALAAILVGAPSPILAQAPTAAVEVGGVPATALNPNNEFSSFTDAVDHVNAEVGKNTSGPYSPVIKVYDDQPFSDTDITTNQPYWHINGYDPTSMNTESMTNLTITGGNTAAGSNSTTLNGPGGVSLDDMATLLAIENVLGTIGISGMNINGGYSTTATTGTFSGPSGGGLMIGMDTTTGVRQAWNNLNLTSVNLTGNQLVVTTGAALGGAMSAYNMTADGVSHGTATLRNVNMQGNVARVDSAAPSGHSAIGGGARLLGIDTIHYLGGDVRLNKAEAVNASHAHGGGLAIEGNAFDANIAGVSFVDNQATYSGTSSNPNGAARGGAFFALNEDTVSASTVNFRSYGSVKTSFENNSAIASGPNNLAQGGAAAFRGNMIANFDGVNIHFNTADGFDAYGGAISMTDDQWSPAQANKMTFADTSIQGNNAWADMTSGTARGGAIYSEGEVEMTGGDLQYNMASGDKAYGGAIFADNNVTLADVSIQNNSVYGTSAATAQGGGVFMETGTASADVNLTLKATTANDTVVVAGNTANGNSSGIHFGSVGGTSNVNAVFNIQGAGTTVLTDALSVSLNNGKSFTMNKTDGGRLEWDNKHVVDAAGGSTVNLHDGYTKFGQDFVMEAANGSDLTLDVQGGSTVVGFDSRRDADQALFEMTGAGGTFAANVAGGTLEMTDMGRQLTNFEKTYVMVADSNNSAAAGSLTNLIDGNSAIAGSTFTVDGNDIVLNVKYTSPYTANINNAGKNTVSASNSLDKLIKDNAITDDMISAIHANLGAVTPEAVLAAGPAAVSTAHFISRMAMNYGQRVQQNTAVLAPYAYAPPSGSPTGGGGANEGVRLWAGVVGNFRNVDRDSGYYGYDHDTHGALMGVNYDLGPTASVGVYGAFTKSTIDMDKLKHNKVESDGTHVGVTARFVPDYGREPNLSVYVDAGYSDYSSDSVRALNQYRASGSFDQKAYTIGAGAEYVMPIDNYIKVTPSLDLRYTKLDQDGFTEKGLTATKIKGLSADSFTSTLGVGASTEVFTTGGVIIPSAKVGWRHEFGDRDYRTSANYLAASGGGLVPGSFKLSTVEVDRDSLDAGVALRALLDTGPQHQFGLNLSYDLNVSKNTDTQTVYGGVEYQF